MYTYTNTFYTHVRVRTGIRIHIRICICVYIYTFVPKRTKLAVTTLLFTLAQVRESPSRLVSQHPQSPTSSSWFAASILSWRAFAALAPALVGDVNQPLLPTIRLWQTFPMLSWEELRKIFSKSFRFFGINISHCCLNSSKSLVTDVLRSQRRLLSHLATFPKGGCSRNHRRSGAMRSLSCAQLHQCICVYVFYIYIYICIWISMCMYIYI